MDPSKLQSDSDNDTHSLEKDDAVVETASSPSDTTTEKEDVKITDATGGVHPEQHNTSDSPKKISFIKRLWGRFNVYLLLFVLVILVAVAITVAMIIKDRTSNRPNEKLDSQNLSEEALEQLASSGSIGDPKQVLTIASNAIFGGTVLVRNNLEVAGGLRVGDDISIPGLTVTGNTQMSQVNADSLAISGAISVQGPLTARGGLSVSGSSTLGALSASQITTGNLQLTGDLNISSHVNASGSIPNLSRGSALGSGGTASVNGSDTAGSVSINTGSSPPAGCFATITFARAFGSTPHVIVTPVGSAAGDLHYYINRSSRDFSICTTNPAGAGQAFGFDYMVMQ